MNRSERMYREMMASGRSMGVRHRLSWRVRRVLNVVGAVVFYIVFSFGLAYGVVYSLGLL